MKGEHKAGYRAPRTGEKRKVRQPLRVDRLPQEVRDAIVAARAAGKTWQETAELASLKAGEALAMSVVHRWYDLRVVQVNKEVFEQLERARVVAAAFAAKGFKDLPEAALNALTSEVFQVMEAGDPAQREKALGNLVFVMSRLITARARQKQVELEREKVELAKKKFEQLGARVQGLKKDIEKKKLSSEELARKLDEIYDISRQSA